MGRSVLILTPKPSVVLLHRTSQAKGSYKIKGHNPNKFIQVKMGNPHVVVISYPAQGHVIPMLELSKCLVKHGIKVTYVNSDFNHKRVLDAMGNAASVGDKISLVSIPDGLEPGQDRNDLGILTPAMSRVMPGKLKELIEKINGSGEDDKVNSILTDYSTGWSLEVAAKLGIPGAAFFPASAAAHITMMSIPKLLEDGIIDKNGTPLKKEKIQLAAKMPSMYPADLVWACIGEMTTQQIIFNAMVDHNRTLKLANMIICNSIHEFEPGAFAYNPSILPIGPLLASNRLEDRIGNFWPDDSTCMKWLDNQPPNSVVYVAFGSFTVFDQTQFQELAIGLELSNRPFLWVVRPDLTSETSSAFPEGFQGRVASKGCLVGWAPQQKVLSHPSVACFVSHCGWNSTMEGACNGIPFLCWPYFADQIFNEKYVCDIWKVGLRFNKNESGIITREEIKNKVEELVGDQGYKLRSLALKELAVKSASQDSQSSKNFMNLVDWIKSKSSH